MRTDFYALQQHSRILIHPKPDNPLHKKPVKGTVVDGYVYCDGSNPAGGPDYYHRDFLQFNEGFDLLNEVN